MKPYPSYKPSGVVWLGDVPSHWQVEKLKFLARIRGEKCDGTDGRRYVGMEHVLPQVGKFNPLTDGAQDTADSTVSVFEKDDVLFGKLRPYLAKCVVADTNGTCSSEFLVLTPATDVHPGYLKATMLLQEFIDTVDASTYGSKMPRADWTFIGQQKLPLPSYVEQQAIADYLDSETARIDFLIQEKEELIGLLRESKASEISSLLLNGVSGEHTKPSGIKWLGNIPSSWTICRIKHTLIRLEQGWSPECENRLCEVNEWGVLKAGACNHGIFSELEHKALPKTLNPIPAYEIMAGDVLMSRASGSADLVGSVAYVEKVRPQLMLSDKMFRLVPEPHVDGCYLASLLNTNVHRRQILASVRGSEGLARNITTTDIKQLWIALPNLEDQRILANQARQLSTQYSNLIAHTQEEITLLKKLRAATIADVVLGRIDVRTAAKP